MPLCRVRAQYMTDATFNWRMMKGIFTKCHVWDAEENYVPFDAFQVRPKRHCNLSQA